MNQEQKDAIREGLRINWHEWDFNKKMSFIFTKLDQAYQQGAQDKVEEIKKKLSIGHTEEDEGWCIAHSEGQDCCIDHFLENNKYE
jgi:hypothetical protein